MTPNAAPDTPATPPRWLVLLLVFGLYLTLRGYHSRDGDQAYRLPILLHRQNPALFAADPFVRAFDTFNPHVGSLMLLDWAARPLGLSAGLFGLFGLTFAATAWGLDRLARTLWPELGSRVGLVAVGLVLAAKAGNVGTNHLFEAMLLDRLMAYALAWAALAIAVERPARGAWTTPPLLGLATFVHPSLGLQLALVLGTSWVAWWSVGTPGLNARRVLGGLLGLGACLLPGLWLNAGQGGALLAGLPAEEFRWLSVELQGPQHMLPHLWRRPQWLAWGCYLVLACLAWPGRDRPRGWDPARGRLALVLVVALAGLAAAWVGVEVVRDLRVTLFQPFRMATLARGLALVLASGRAVRLWRTGRWIDRARVLLVAAGLGGDWALIVATSFDATVAVLEGLGTAWADMARLVRRTGYGSLSPGGGRGQEGPVPRVGRSTLTCHAPDGLALLALAGGLWFLSRHDTESGQVPLAAALGLAALAGVIPPLAWRRRRMAFALAAAWTVPAAAFLVVPHVSRGDAPAWQRALVERCRFRATPVGDVERLAVWCRAHTPPDARFVGPPGPKTFRLWSLRSIAFNRAASPYHAAALADWFRRFQDHVDDHSPPAEFVRLYQGDRHGLERRYQALGDARRAALARREGGDYVIAAPPEHADAGGPLELLHIEGRYAVYRLRPAATMAASAGTG